MNDSMLAIILVFGAVAAIAFFVSRLFMGDGSDTKLLTWAEVGYRGPSLGYPEYREGI